jgi:hypothetical protein
VTSIATDRRYRGMTHRVCSKALGRVGMAVAALNRASGNMRRRGLAGGGGAVVAARAIGVACLVDVSATGPACESRGRTGVASNAVAATGCDVASV